MYFALLEGYVIWLIFPAAIGLVTFIIRNVYPKSEDSDSMDPYEISILVFSMLLAIGSTIFDQVWIRIQNELSWIWGTTNMNDIQTQRPSFKGVYGKDPITGQKKKIEKPSSS